MPGIPEQGLKEAARPGREHCSPASAAAQHSHIWGNAMGLRALWTFLGGLWLLAGMEKGGSGQGRWS